MFSPCVILKHVRSRYNIQSGFACYNPDLGDQRMVGSQINVSVFDRNGIRELFNELDAVTPCCVALTILINLRSYPRPLLLRSRGSSIVGGRRPVLFQSELNLGDGLIPDRRQEDSICTGRTLLLEYYPVLSSTATLLHQSLRLTSMLGSLRPTSRKRIG